MDRLACIDVFELPLQLLLERHPEWRDRPVVVTAHDRPHSEISWVNEEARRLGVLPGMRFSAALSFARDLEAGVITDRETARALARLVAALRKLSPEVEPSLDEPGVFWVGLRGMDLLWPSLADWAEQARLAIEEMELHAVVVVGFSRFGTYAVARSKTGGRSRNGRIEVFESQKAEKQRARSVRLSRLPIPPDVREQLHHLGAHTLGDLVRLPAGGILKRYGKHVHRIHEMASGKLELPLDAGRPAPSRTSRLDLDSPEPYISGVLFLLKRLLHPIVDRLASREEGVGELSIGLQLEDGDFIEDRIRPSEPTRQIHVLLDLTRLRLESRGLSADVESLSVDVKPVGIHPGQQPLFGRRSQRDIQRDLGAGSRALARVRAELGDDSVCRARLRRAHLPDAQFVWEPMTGLASPGSKKAGSAPPPEPPSSESRSPNQTGRALIRRFCSKPVPLTRRHRKFSSELAEAEEKARGEPMGDLEEIRLPEELGGGAPSGCAGPYLVSGGWWIEPVFREYCFLQSRRGDLLWVYYDRRRRRWYMCGKVE